MLLMLKIDFKNITYNLIFKVWIQFLSYVLHQLETKEDQIVTYFPIVSYL